MKLVVGNLAGTFATILLYLKWMTVSDIPENETSLYFHWVNKTDFPHNTFFSYDNFRWRSCNYNQIDKCFLTRFNYINDIFSIKQDESLNFEFYTEDYPYTFLNSIKVYPDIFHRHDGSGSSVKQYFDKKSLKEIRNLYNEHFKKLQFSEALQSKINEEVKLINGKKVLTVMLRTSNHYPGLGSAFNYIDKILDQTKSIIDNYDNVLIITQVKEFFDIFVQTFGDRCIFPNRTRLAGDNDWKGNDGLKIMTNEEYKKEIEECIIDVALSSHTNHILSGPSNMFFGSLCMNPNISFDILDVFKDTNGA